MSSNTDQGADLKVCVEVNPPMADQEWVWSCLAQHSAEAAGSGDHSPLSIFLRDRDGKPQGGLLGWSLWSWLHIDSIFVEESHRGQGYGGKLLQAAERVARVRGCKVIEVQTFNFLALSFYTQAGYEIFGTLKGIGRGKIERYYLKKELP